MSSTNNNSEELKKTVNGTDNNPKDKWGLPTTDLYRLALIFYREKKDKVFTLSYEDNMRLLAYTKQVSYGKFDPDKCSPVGVFNLHGRDRSLAWQALGEMSKDAAMDNFISTIDSLCPLFQPYIEAHKRDAEEKERLAQESAEKKRKKEEEDRILAEKQRQEEEEASRQEAQRRGIQEALNEQTFTQFKSYAEQQFPGNPEEQAVLIRQLQEQHYHQYMQQLLHNQSAIEGNLEAGGSSQSGSEAAVIPFNNDSRTVVSNGDLDDADPEEEDISGDFPELSTASMWTRKDVKEFKESIRKETREAVIKVGHGETVTVRVPTHKKGSCLVWEFATDHYDIGFGLFFEWTKPTTNAVTVNISESEEDDEDEEEDEEEMVYRQSNDIEAGSEGTVSQKNTSRPLISVIVPVYRRDSQEEVYAGTHTYPGEGVYLLKFDNSYSLWRSKTLYYRVCYTQ